MLDRFCGSIQASDLMSAIGTERNCLGAHRISGAEGRPTLTVSPVSQPPTLSGSVFLQQQSDFLSRAIRAVKDLSMP